MEHANALAYHCFRIEPRNLMTEGRLIFAKRPAHGEVDIKNIAFVIGDADR